MSLKQVLRHVLDEINYNINRFTGYTYWLHIGDLLIPCDGTITSGQYIVASRIIDIENMLAGNEPEWQGLMTEKIYGRTMEAAELEKSNTKFSLLVNSLCRRGLSPNICKCSISDDPIVLNNGTHRIAWCAVCQPNTYLPFVRDRHDLAPWFPIDGEEYFSHLLSNSELQQLTERYRKVIEEEVQTFLFGFVISQDIADLETALIGIGEIINRESILIESESFVVFRYRLYRQRMYTRRDQIRSHYVDEIENRLANNHNCKLGHTVTESIALETSIEEKIGRKLFDQP